MLKERGAVPLMGWKYEPEEAAKVMDLPRMRRALKDKHMDPNVICDRGATRLNRAIFETPLHAALSPWKRNPDLVELLLDSGASVHVRQADGRTPLHLAVRRNDRCLKMLIDRGADITTQADDGSTPAHDVCRLPKADTFLGFRRLAEADKGLP